MRSTQRVTSNSRQAIGRKNAASRAAIKNRRARQNSTAAKIIDLLTASKTPMTVGMIAMSLGHRRQLISGILGDHPDPRIDLLINTGKVLKDFKDYNYMPRWLTKRCKDPVNAPRVTDRQLAVYVGLASTNGLEPEIVKDTTHVTGTLGMFNRTLMRSNLSMRGIREATSEARDTVVNLAIGAHNCILVQRNFDALLKETNAKFDLLIQTLGGQK